MRDPYTVLGVPRSASEKEVKIAYRKLAKSYHPDQNQDDPKAQGKFAEATNAYELLSDREKRSKFDRGEIDAEGNPTMAGFDFSGFANGRRGAGGAGGAGARGHSAEDILKEFMGGFGGSRAGGPMGQDFGGAFKQPPRRSADAVASVRVTLEQVSAASAVDVRLNDSLAESGGDAEGDVLQIAEPRSFEPLADIRRRHDQPIQVAIAEAHIAPGRSLRQVGEEGAEAGRARTRDEGR